MSFIAWMIYAGGDCSMLSRKIGFWRRVCWPIELGEVIFQWMMEQRK